MKVLAFDLSGRFGHFKKFYTTSSPLTFSTPTPTALFGMVGAILGLDKDSYLYHINAKTTKVGIQILAPIQKMRLSLNYIDTKNSRSFHLIKNRTQIRTEFLINPSYRIYLHLQDSKLFEQLITFIKEKKTYYTPSLGMANLLANIRFVAVKEVQKEPLVQQVATIIPIAQVHHIQPKAGHRYVKERLPVNMLPQRIVDRYVEFLIESNAKKLEGEFKDCYLFGSEAIAMV